MEFDFIHPDGAPGQLHQALGDAGFKSYLESQTASTEANSMMCASHSAVAFARSKRIEAVSNVLHIFALLAILFAVPLLVLLWEKV